MNTFLLHWLTPNKNPSPEIIKGFSIANAFSVAGYSAGALQALDYYSECRVIADNDSIKGDSVETFPPYGSRDNRVFCRPHHLWGWFVGNYDYPALPYYRVCENGVYGDVKTLDVSHTNKYGDHYESLTVNECSNTPTHSDKGWSLYQRFVFVHKFIPELNGNYEQIRILFPKDDDGDLGNHGFIIYADPTGASYVECVLVNDIDNFFATTFNRSKEIVMSVNVSDYNNALISLLPYPYLTFDQNEYFVGNTIAYPELTSTQRVATTLNVVKREEYEFIEEVMDALDTLVELTSQWDKKGSRPFCLYPRKNIIRPLDVVGLREQDEVMVPAEWKEFIEHLCQNLLPKFYFLYGIDVDGAVDESTWPENFEFIRPGISMQSGFGVQYKRIYLHFNNSYRVEYRY